MSRSTPILHRPAGTKATSMNTSHAYWTDIHQASRTELAVHEAPETKSNEGFAGGDVTREEWERVISLALYARDEHGERLSRDTIDNVMKQSCFRGRSNVLGMSDKAHWDSKSMLTHLELRATSLERAALARVKEHRERFGEEAQKAFWRWKRLAI